MRTVYFTVSLSSTPDIDLEAPWSGIDFGPKGQGNRLESGSASFHDKSNTILLEVTKFDKHDHLALW